MRVQNLVKIATFFWSEDGMSWAGESCFDEDAFLISMQLWVRERWFETTSTVRTKINTGISPLCGKVRRLRSR
jgi:hypothetical protein